MHSPVVKLTLGRGVMMIDFFIIPVVGVGWFASSPRWGYVVALAAALDSAVLAVHAETQASWQTAALNGAARFALYVVILALRRAGRATESRDACVIEAARDSQGATRACRSLAQRNPSSGIAASAVDASRVMPGLDSSERMTHAAAKARRGLKGWPRSTYACVAGGQPRRRQA
jgi:hypothetical protein